jgi:hypothetical protein
VISLLDVVSPKYSAKLYWGCDASVDELPHIRSISDVAWGFWSCLNTQNVQAIKYLVVAQIENEETKGIVTRAIGNRKLAVWPGMEFGMKTDEGKALLDMSSLDHSRDLLTENLRSPVGRWAGYFLMQHMDQLGSNKFIDRVRVFSSDTNGKPYLIFYVEDPDRSEAGVEERNIEEEGERVVSVADGWKAVMSRRSVVSKKTKKKSGKKNGKKQKGRKMKEGSSR